MAKPSIIFLKFKTNLNAEYMLFRWPWKEYFMAIKVLDRKEQVLEESGQEK